MRWLLSPARGWQSGSTALPGWGKKCHFWGLWRARCDLAGAGAASRPGGAPGAAGAEGGRRPLCPGFIRAPAVAAGPVVKEVAAWGRARTLPRKCVMGGAAPPLPVPREEAAARLHGDGAGESGPARPGPRVRGPRRRPGTPGCAAGTRLGVLHPHTRSDPPPPLLPRCRAGVTARGSRCPCGLLSVCTRGHGLACGGVGRESAGPARCQAAGGEAAGGCPPPSLLPPRARPAVPVLRAGSLGAPGPPSLLHPVSRLPGG